MAISGFEGETAAIYCRISHVKDDDQTGVDRQERICRDLAERLGVNVDPKHVFVDNSRSAWQRNRKRKGWDALLAAIEAREIRHVLTYHPDRLMRQPWDLETLLSKSEDHQVMLHGQANRKDLSNADDRFMLRIEVAHACRSSDDTSRRVKEAQKDALAAGKAHGGRRAYGYRSDMTAVIKDEAEIVKWMYQRFLDGDAIHGIAMDLNWLSVPTATGAAAWTAGRVRQLLDSPRHAGLILFNDVVQKDEDGSYRMGKWPAIVTVGEWEEVCRLRARRSQDYNDARRSFRHYPLSGMVLCTRCALSMVGGQSKDKKPYYQCTRRHSTNPNGCTRAIGAEELEKFVMDAAKDFLTNLSPSDLVASPATTTAEDAKAAEQADSTKLAEIREMWDAGEIETGEMRQMQAVVKKRMTARQRATVVRPLTALEGIVIGPGAAESFDKLTEERKAAALRFLFPAVRIGESTTRGVFDFGRINIDPPKLLSH